MNERTMPENAFGLRWVQDDQQGRIIRGPTGDYRTPADAIRSLGLGCEEAVLTESLNRFPPYVRIHGGFTAGVGEPASRFTLTWEPGTLEASYTQSCDALGENMSGSVDVPPGGSLKEVLRDLLIPDAQDVVCEAREHGRAVRMKDVDFWIGDQHFVSDEEAS